jgi:hypothetical protein
MEIENTIQRLFEISMVWKIISKILRFFKELFKLLGLKFDIG